MKRNHVWVVEWRPEGKRRYIPWESTPFESVAHDVLNKHKTINPRFKFRLRKYTAEQSTGGS